MFMWVYGPVSIHNHTQLAGKADSDHHLEILITTMVFSMVGVSAPVTRLGWEGVGAD